MLTEEQKKEVSEEWHKKVGTFFREGVGTAKGEGPKEGGTRRVANERRSLGGSGCLGTLLDT